MALIPVFTRDNWETAVLRSDRMVVVDFRAPWCALTQLEEMSLGRLSNIWKDQVRIGWIDVSRFPELAVSYRIQEVPTVALFRGGKLIKSFSGHLRAEELIQDVLSAEGLTEIGSK